MMSPRAWEVAKKLALAALLWEAFWWTKRRLNRSEMYVAALRRAQEIGRPLVVIGAPDGGVTAGYGHGDVTVDLVRSKTAPNPVVADITKHIPLGDDSSVVFVSCVLEYVGDVQAAMREIRRVAGSDDNVFIVRVEPWTLTALLYPGAKRVLPAGGKLLGA